MAMFVEDQAVEVDVFKRDFSGAIEAKHDHAADPGEKDVGGSFHHGVRIERRGVIGCMIGSDERPLSRREPGVEGVFVAGIKFTVDFDFGLVDSGVEDPVPCPVVKGGNGNAPRDLAGNVPIFEVF